MICDKCHLGPLIGKVRLVSESELLIVSVVIVFNPRPSVSPSNTLRQLKWRLPPICFFPDEMRGTAVNELQEQDIDNCVEIIESEDLDAASTSYNFLESGERRGSILELEL